MGCIARVHAVEGFDCLKYGTRAWTLRCSISMCSSRMRSTRLRMPMRLSRAALSDMSDEMRPVSSDTLSSSSETLFCTRKVAGWAQAESQAGHKQSCRLGTSSRRFLGK